MQKPTASLRSLLALAVAAGFAAPVLADDVPLPEHGLTGNLGLFSSYRFRGLDQTFGHPAVQGGFDYTHASGLYAGNWNSNVSSGAGYPDGNLEMDFYAGYKQAFADFGIDVGGLYYYYPGSSFKGAALNARHPSSTDDGTVHNGELYLAASWKFLSLKYSYAVTDYFNLPKTRGTGYLDLSANYDLGDGWGINGHVGHLFMKDFSYTNADGSRYDGAYTDWKLGVTKDLSGWVVAASYIDTDAQGRCSNSEFYCFGNSLGENGSANGSRFRNAGRGTAVVSVAKSF